MPCWCATRCATRGVVSPATCERLFGPERGSRGTLSVFEPLLDASYNSHNCIHTAWLSVFETVLESLTQALSSWYKVNCVTFAWCLLHGQLCSCMGRTGPHGTHGCECGCIELMGYSRLGCTDGLHEVNNGAAWAAWAARGHMSCKGLHGAT
eukprot:354921-Chlamydomonas_euryale.AAC.1